MKRRLLLLAGAVLFVATAVMRLIPFLGCERRSAPEGPEPPSADSIFPLETRELLLAIAAAIVPRSGEHPAASEIDLRSRLEAWVRAQPGLPSLYRREWPRFARELRARTPSTSQSPVPEAITPLLLRWHEAYRAAGRPSAEALFFEQLRRDVLRVYYASPAGWASVGYAGPVRRAHPRAEPGA